MDKRILKISFGQSGSKTINNKISLPTNWVRKMGITEQDREVEVYFNGEEITIKKIEK